jgi:HIV Tat-specific factor 1
MEEFFSKAGIIKTEFQTNKKKIKIYSENNICKGDGLIGYQREESISLAIEMLNEREIKPGYVIFLERAKLELNQE